MRYQLLIKEDSTNLSTEDMDIISKASFNGIEAITKSPGDNSFPIPWDAKVYIEDAQVVLEGYAGAGGYGTCVTKVPIKKYTQDFSLEVEITSEDPADDTDILSVFTKSNWTIRATNKATKSNDWYVTYNSIQSVAQVYNNSGKSILSIDKCDIEESANKDMTEVSHKQLEDIIFECYYNELVEAGVEDVEDLLV